MKLTKIFGIVLSLHVAVILLVMFQPGCQTSSGGGTEESSNNATDSFNAPPEDGETGGDGLAETPDGERPRTSPTPPDEEGFVPTEPGDAPSGGLRTYTVVRGDMLSTIARKHGTTPERLQQINNIPDSEKDKLSIGQELRVPVAAGSDDTTIIKPEGPAPVTPVRDVHIVKPRENLTKIAATYNVSVSALKAKNNLQSDLINAGQRLLIPVPSSAIVPVPENPPTDSSDSRKVIHVIKSGDNLTRIANRYGVSVDSLKKLNPNADPNRLQPGQTLIVKTAPSSAPVSDASSSDDAGKEESIESLFNKKPPVVPLPAKED